eukprot:s2944_g3.t1
MRKFWHVSALLGFEFSPATRLIKEPAAVNHERPVLNQKSGQIWSNHKNSQSFTLDHSNNFWDDSPQGGGNCPLTMRHHHHRACVFCWAWLPYPDHRTTVPDPRRRVAVLLVMLSS